jgi:hypothetical protein
VVEPRRLLETLHRNGVEFVVGGAVAAIVQGYPLPTEDLDVTPAYHAENLERLTVALRELEARLRVPDQPTGLEFPVDARMLAQADVWTFTTRYGDLDLVFTPAGTRGYPDLRRDAVEIDLGVPVLVASLRDVIRSKEAAGRPKDLAQLPALRQTLEVIRERERRERR